AELRRQHGEEQRAGLRRILTERGGRDVEATVRALVSAGVAGHARSLKLQRVFTEQMPALAHRDVAEADAPLFDALRRFLRSPDVAVRDVDLALWVISTAGGAVIHRAVVERPEDLSSGAITEELVRLLTRYLRRA